MDYLLYATGTRILPFQIRFFFFGGDEDNYDGDSFIAFPYR